MTEITYNLDIPGKLEYFLFFSAFVEPAISM